MSKQDYERDMEAILMFVGSPFAVTFADNSLKCRFDLLDHRKSYLWIDPPWLFIDVHGRTLLDSLNMSDDNAHSLHHDALQALEHQVLLSLAYDDEFGAVLGLNGELRLCVPDYQKWIGKPRNRTLGLTAEEVDAGYGDWGFDDFIWRL